MSARRRKVTNKYQWKAMFRKVRMTEIQRALLDELEDRFDDSNGGSCQKPATYFAKSLNIHARTVESYLRLFQAANWIKVEPIRGSSGNRISWSIPVMVNRLDRPKRRGTKASKTASDSGAQGPESKAKVIPAQTGVSARFDSGPENAESSAKQERCASHTLNATLTAGPDLQSGPVLGAASVSVVVVDEEKKESFKSIVETNAPNARRGRAGAGLSDAISSEEPAADDELFYDSSAKTPPTFSPPPSTAAAADLKILDLRAHAIEMAIDRHRNPQGGFDRKLPPLLQNLEDGTLVALDSNVQELEDAIEEWEGESGPLAARPRSSVSIARSKNG